MKNQILDEKVIKEQRISRESAGNKLVESYAKREDIVGSNWLESAHTNPEAMRRTAIAMAEQERYMRPMKESVISSSFPIELQNLLRVIRLTYPNMIFPEIYTSFQMQAWHDAMYIIDTLVGSTKRDGTAGQKTFETALARYTATEELVTVDATGATTNYAGTIASVAAPLVPYKTFIYVGNSPVAVDNGAGVFSDSVFGAGTLSTGTPSTINYTTGAYDITFASAPGQAITLGYLFDSEVEANFDELATVDLSVREITFRPEPNQIGVSWSHIAELQLQGTLNQNIEDILTTASVDLIRQNKDIRALRFGYGVAKKKTPITWSANYVAANTLTLKDHLDTFTYAINRASAAVFDAGNRGRINKMYGTANTMALLMNHRDFVADNSMLAIGPHKIGSIKGMDLYQVPTAVMYDANDPQAVNDICLVYKDEEDAGYVSIAFGEYTPIIATPTIEYGNATQGFKKERGLQNLADKKVVEPKFITRIRVTDIPTS